MTSRTLLVELGTEELPPKSLRSLAEAFADKLTAELAGATIPHGQVEWFATPRRLAIKIADLAANQSDRYVEKRGPALAQAFDANGQPTKAAIGWANSCGISVEQAEQLHTEKGTWLCYRATLPGEAVQQLLLPLIQRALSQLPINKPMRWGNNDTQFIRPIHTATLLYGDEVIAGEILGVAIANQLLGHRFMGRANLVITHADEYVPLLLEQGHVMADYAQRKAKIKQGVTLAAEQLGGIADISDALLEEVTSLVEWPVVLTAQFDAKFLQVPAEALVYTMKGDQKYFPVYDAQGQLMPHFIFVANIESRDPSQIIHGNEKVVRPRLADAEFFFNTDRKQRLADRLPLLESVLFQQQLGSLRDKSERVAALASWIAEQIGADVTLAHRAGLLSKCDLMTNMVFEFTETQGIMGMHYARLDGENEHVAVAINEHYLPRFSGDVLPSSHIASAVAIADKIDTLVGIFGIGQPPKGDKDPFALRRAALGTLRIMVENQLSLDLTTLIPQAIALYQERLSVPEKVMEELIDFMLARCRAWYLEAGYSVDVLQAVLARRPTQPTDFERRIKAVSHFKTLPQALDLAAANKRVANILEKAAREDYPAVQSALLSDRAEIALANHLTQLQQTLAPLWLSGDYQAILVHLASLHEPINAFFDDVMVMVDDQDVKLNRLALLAQLRDMFLHIADISLLQ